MRLLYATSITLPSYRANRVQTTSMARAWTGTLGKDFILGVGSAGGELLRGVNYLVMGEGVRSYRLAWRYLSYAKQNKFTHVYCREEKLLFFMIVFNLLFFRLPLRFCYELHHLVYMDAWWHKFLLRRVDRVISVTGAMKDALVEHGYSGDRVLVAPDAADPAIFDTGLTKREAREKLGLPLDKQVIVYTGAINELWKGVDTLYEAAKRCDDSYLFLIVGGKPHYVENFHAQHPELPHFQLVGHKPHKDIPFYLKCADVGVLPNSGNSEMSRVATSPMKLFEYMASGTPIVASDLPAIREILSEKNALLVAPDDPDALAGGIRAMAEQPQRAVALAAQALRDVAAHTWDARAAAVTAFLQAGGNFRVS